MRKKLEEKKLKNVIVDIYILICTFSIFFRKSYSKNVLT